MRLFIAEKPSLGRAITDVLPTPHKKIEGVKNALRVGNGDIVAWLAGHILYQAPPEAYNEQFKQWNINVLPIIPNEWILLVRPDTKDFFNGIKKLLREASEVVNAGDPGREGQLLVDEVIEHCRYKGPVKRVLISDLNPEAVEKAISEMQPNEKFKTLKESALARARLDWIHGLNMTRLYTKLAQMKGFQGVLRIGRVKTPVVALVVKRDLEIESFTSKPFQQLQAEVMLPEGHLRANWVPSDTQGGLDEEGRLCSVEIASAIKSRLEGKPAKILRSEKKTQKIPPPLGYNLTKLQIDCSKQFALAAHETLEICQGLYESGITTYPRSSCRFLPEGHHAQAANVLQNILKFIPDLNKMIVDADTSRKNKIFDDSKVVEHHAIIPTPRAKQVRSLTPNEEKVFGLLARRYIAFLYPDYEYEQTTIEAVIDGECFKAQGKRTIKEGWKVVSNDQEEENWDEEREIQETIIPPANVGDLGTCDEIIINEKKTTPPARYTEASLLAAMESVAKFVKDPEVKKVLKETEGLGTEATRSTILKELFESGQLVRDGKKIQSTKTAKMLIDALPEEITLPDMTASWELAFHEIVEGQTSLDAAMKSFSERISGLVQHAKDKGPIAMANAGTVITGKTASKAPKKPVKTAKGMICNKCGKTMIRRSGTGKNGKQFDFYGCSGFPACRETKPVK